MLRFILTRLSLVVPTFIGMTLIAFLMIRLVPGDPIETLAGERGIDPERHAQLVKAYGLDQPVLVQYGIYIGRVLHGDPEAGLAPSLRPFRFEKFLEVARAAMIRRKLTATTAYVDALRAVGN